MSDFLLGMMASVVAIIAVALALIWKTAEAIERTLKDWWTR